MTKSTIEIYIKGCAFVGAAICISLTQALAQWVNSGELPSRFQWAVIIISACGAGFTSVLSFMSGSYTEYKASKNGSWNSNTPKPIVPPATT